VLFVYSSYFYLLADARWMEVCVGVGAAAFTVYVYKQTVELLGVIFLFLLWQFLCIRCGCVFERQCIAKVKNILFFFLFLLDHFLFLSFFYRWCLKKCLVFVFSCFCFGFVAICYLDGYREPLRWE
jgi:hypothetical protein